MQSVKHLCSILHDFNWQCARTVPLHYQSFLLRYGVHKPVHHIRVIACCDLDLWPQNLISKSTNPNTSVTKLGWNFLRWFVRYDVHNVSGSLLVIILTFEIWCWLQYLISTSTNRNTSVTKIGEIPFIRPPDILCRRTSVLPGIFFFFLSFFFFFVSYSLSSLNGTKPYSTTWSEVSVV